MMIISHRGNLRGPSIIENHPDQIIAATKNFHVEVDLWMVNGYLYLGHDNPEYQVDNNFLHNPKLIWHCKNLEALYYMSRLRNCHYFWHQEDQYTLTSEQYIWTYPGQPTCKNSIIVDSHIKDFGDIAGVCTDYPEKLKEFYDRITPKQSEFALYTRSN